ncbi:MAG: serine hydrolase domain-containing protein [Rhizomicrobium sp.]|jgi:CubicO group peptidase (beta-lactamase class C family)
MNVTAPAPIAGTCDPRFSAVRDAFARNFAHHGEPGAAVALSLNGRPVVDLWGGWSDLAQTRPWADDTLVNFFSVGKALTAVCMLQLHERGIIDIDSAVAHYWPEFVAHGKDAITVRHVLSHRAGLPAIRESLADGAMLDWTAMTVALAQQTPWWQPGTAHGYHVNTFGYLLGEVAKRASGRTIGALLQETIAGPLNADVHIGLADAFHARVAEFHWPAGNPKSPVDPSDELALMRWNTYWNPPGLSGSGWVNRTEWRRAEMPSTNGHGTARGVARIYAALANGGGIDGVPILNRSSLLEATAEHSYGIDLILDRATRFGLGFQLTHPERLLGPNPRSFGHFGAGGSLGFCDPDAGLAFGYVTCDMGPRWQNPRNQALIDAVYASL